MIKKMPKTLVFTGVLGKFDFSNIYVYIGGVSGTQADTEH